MVHRRDFRHEGGFPINEMKTTISMIAAIAAFATGGLSADVAIGTASVEVVAADEQTITLEVSGLR